MKSHLEWNTNNFKNLSTCHSENLCRKNRRSEGEAEPNLINQQVSGGRPELADDSPPPPWEGRDSTGVSRASSPFFLSFPPQGALLRLGWGSLWTPPVPQSPGGRGSAPVSMSLHRHLRAPAHPPRLPPPRLSVDTHRGETDTKQNETPASPGLREDGGNSGTLVWASVPRTARKQCPLSTGLSAGPSHKYRRRALGVCSGACGWASSPAAPLLGWGPQGGVPSKLPRGQLRADPAPTLLWDRRLGAPMFLPQPPAAPLAPRTHSRGAASPPPGTVCL